MTTLQRRDGREDIPTLRGTEKAEFVRQLQEQGVPENIVTKLSEMNGIPHREIEIACGPNKELARSISAIWFNCMPAGSLASSPIPPR